MTQRNVLFLVTKKTKTSVPVQWAKYIREQHPDIVITFLMLSNFFNAIKLIQRADIIHIHHIKVGILYLPIILLKRKRFIFTLHGNGFLQSKTNIWLSFVLVYFSAHCVCVSASIRQSVMEKLGRFRLVEKKLIVIPNGIDTEYVKSFMQPANSKRKTIKIAHPARFVQEKNHKYIIEALANYSGDYSLEVYFIGDGPLMHGIENSARDKGNVSYTFMGALDHQATLELLASSDVLIMPSISEGLNIAFLEALTLELPVIVSCINSFTDFAKLHCLSEADGMFFIDIENFTDLNVLLRDTPYFLRRYTRNIHNWDISNMMNKYKILYMREL